MDLCEIEDPQVVQNVWVTWRIYEHAPGYGRAATYVVIRSSFRNVGLGWAGDSGVCILGEDVCCEARATGLL